MYRPILACHSRWGMSGSSAARPRLPTRDAMPVCFWAWIRCLGQYSWPTATTTKAARRSTCSSDARSENPLEPAAFRQLLDLLEHERGLVPGAGVLMPARHLRECSIALFGG